MHIPKGQMPPVKGFWSLTVDDDQKFYPLYNSCRRVFGVLLFPEVKAFSILGQYLIPYYEQFVRPCKA
jgi:hypothetical protein